MIAANAGLAWIAVGIALATLGVGAATMVVTIRHHLGSSRVESARDRVQAELFERLFATDPDWEAWIQTLSRAERRQVETLLEEYLRRLRGTEHARLRDLGTALGIPTRARRELADGGGRFRALTWLALLEEPVDPTRLEACCTDTPRHRAGAARVLYRSGHPDAAAAGTDILLGDGDRPLTAFGMDTLYRLNDGTDTPLLSRLESDADAWNQRLVVQALLVVRYCNIADPGERLGWLPEVLESESPRVRAAAVGVVERHGWRDHLQDEIDIEALLADPDPAVRRETYQLLASWGDERSAAWLREALETDTEQDMLALVRAFLVHPRTELPESIERLEPFVEWVRADESVGRRRRVWGVSAAWS
jgi:hypothetical protein